MPLPIIIYVDIDDTLVRSVGTKRIPMTGVIEHVKRLKAEGAVLYCWSSGGGDYARQSAEDVGLAECFSGFLPKPNVVIDDQEFADWRRFAWAHPNSCASQCLESYRKQLEAKP